MRSVWKVLTVGAAVVGVQTGAYAATMFQATLTPAQVVPKTGGADPDGVSTASGTAMLTLNDAGTQLAYTLTLSGLDLTNPFNPVDANDVTGIHFHVGAPGVNGPHTLNVFGMPGEDDGDLDKSQIASGILSGIWDDGDETGATPGDSKKLTDFLGDLTAGNLYFQVHTIGFPAPNTGELRGQVVPEPASAAMLALGSLLLIRRRRVSS